MKRVQQMLFVKNVQDGLWYGLPEVPPGTPNQRIMVIKAVREDGGLAHEFPGVGVQEGYLRVTYVPEASHGGTQFGIENYNPGAHGVYSYNRLIPVGDSPPKSRFERWCERLTSIKRFFGGK